MDNIETKVADTILQKPYKVEIGGVTYEVAPPSIATLVIVSSLIAKLPQVNLNEKNVLLETLRVAKDCSVLGDIVAVLILGADNLKEEIVIVEKHLFGIIRKKTKAVIDNQYLLSKEILNKLTPRQVNNTTIEILNRMEVGDFFGLTASLIEVNLTKPTKDLTGTAEMIVSGQ